MKIAQNHILLIFCVICFVGNAWGSEIIYDIYHYPQKIGVKLQLTGNNSGVTKLNIPDKIWGHDLSKQIKNITIESNNASLEGGSLSHYKENDLIDISYDIINLSTDRVIKYFYSHSNQEGFFFLHDLALIYPEYPEDSKVTINYHSNKYIQNLHVTDQVKIGSKISTTLSELKGGMSISGSDEILQISKLGNDYFLGYGITQKNFTTLQHLTNKVSNAQKGICNTQFNSNFFVFIGNNSDRSSYRGSFLKNSLILFLIPNSIDELTFKNLISHENFHKIIGNKNLLKIHPKDNKVYKWFSEGFTDFFAHKLNASHDIVSYKEYLYSYNKIIYRYFSSPHVNDKNRQLYSQYWKTGAAAKQTLYDRGHIMAQELDLRINRISGKSLEDALCVMVKQFQQDKDLFFSKQLLVDSIKSITDQDFETQIDDMIDGKINLSETLEKESSSTKNSHKDKLHSIPQYIYKNTANPTLADR